MNDPCCPRCKGPLGICRQKRCWHHLEAQTSKPGHDRSTYRDPTAREALYNIGREQNKGRRT